jgi:hypothetical protein
VHRHVTQPLGFGAKSTVGALSPCGTGQSGATPDSPVPCDFVALTFAAALFMCQVILQSAVARVSRCSASAPDSLVAHLNNLNYTTFIVTLILWWTEVYSCLVACLCTWSFMIRV